MLLLYERRTTRKMLRSTGLALLSIHGIRQVCLPSMLFAVPSQSRRIVEFDSVATDAVLNLKRRDNLSPRFADDNVRPAPECFSVEEPVMRLRTNITVGSNGRTFPLSAHDQHLQWPFIVLHPALLTRSAMDCRLNYTPFVQTVYLLVHSLDERTGKACFVSGYSCQYCLAETGSSRYCAGV